MRKTRIYKLTQADVDHIMACLKDRDDGHDAGWYFGNKEQFELRHKYLLNYFDLHETASAKG